MALPELGLPLAIALPGSGFGYHQVGGLRVTRVLLDGKLHLVALVQRTRTPGADTRVVDEYIAGLITGDEAVALTVTEPLNGSCDPLLFHSCSLSFPLEFEGAAVPQEPQLPDGFSTNTMPRSPG